MKDQLIAIAILLGTAFGLFWIRHFVLTVATRKANAASMREDDERRSDDFADDEPLIIAWLTTADNQPLPDEVEAVATAGKEHSAKPHLDVVM